MARIQIRTSDEVAARLADKAREQNFTTREGFLRHVLIELSKPAAVDELGVLDSKLDLIWMQGQLGGSE